MGDVNKNSFKFKLTVIMKNYRFLLYVILSLIVCMSAKGQYYNPYMYQQQMQAARNYGANLFQQKLKEIEQREKADPTSCQYRISSYIASNDLEKAEEWCGYLKKVNKSEGYQFLGIVYELQGYPNLAKEQYLYGTIFGSRLSEKYLERLNTEGEMTEEQKKQVRNFYRDLIAMSYNMTNQIINDTQISSHQHFNSNSYDVERRKTKRTNCTSCGGTGIDHSYHYDGYTPSIQMMGYYNRSGDKCPYCGRYTAHGHDKCIDCLK